MWDDAGSGYGVQVRFNTPLPRIPRDPPLSLSSRMTTALAMEWLETDGLGGFCSSTVAQLPTRGYHALLLAAACPPVNRFTLINTIDAWIELRPVPASSAQPPQIIRLFRHCFASPDSFSGVLHPQVAAAVETFTSDLWPKWLLRVTDSLCIEQEILVPAAAPVTVITFKATGLPKKTAATLCIRPLLSGRDMHAMHHENPAFNFTPESSPSGAQIFRPYGNATPAAAIAASGSYTHAPTWYKNFLYREDQARQQNCIEDLASPGVYSFDLSKGEALFVLSAVTETHAAPAEDLRQFVDLARATETRRRRAFRSPLERAADQYLVKRGEGSSIIAGYPWFTDWGRDTFISIRGLCLAAGHLHQAHTILSAWAKTIDGGMIPNRFVDHGEAPEYHAIDASLWFVIAAGEFLELAAACGYAAHDSAALQAAMLAIVNGYKDGTRYHICLDTRDGLIRGGTPGFALTWMDARIGSWCVTPRIGKPIEIQALWIRALDFVSRFAPEWTTLQRQARESVEEKFFNEKRQCLYDLIDVNFETGHNDPALRPNQVFALGALGASLVSQERTSAALATVEKNLVTPMGLRTLAPDEKAYCVRYEGNLESRDSAYHQGTVWPWLLGPFAEAWVRNRSATTTAKTEARKRFLDPLLLASRTPGSGGISINHIAEIADAQPPHIGRGCPFQAWSLAEAIRLDAVILKH